MASTDASLEGVLEFIRENRGFDFTGYKRPSLQRRITKRMQTVGIDGYDTTSSTSRRTRTSSSSCSTRS